MRTPVLLLALALLAGGCGGDGGGGQAATAAPGAAVATEPSADDPLVGRTLEGELLSLRDLRGEYVFVNVWASW